MMKKLTIILCILLCVLGLTACGREETDEGKSYSVYYLSNSETKTEAHEYELQSEEPEEQVKELLLALQTNPASLKFKAPLAMGFQLLDYNISAGKILLNVSKEYKNLTVTQEILVRASVVKTLTQLPKINFVAFTVDGEQLLDSLGSVVGWMNRDQFVENEGNEINTYQEVTLTLYFANETGDGLMKTERTKEYNTNISMEKLIVEELIKGPNGTGIYPTINAQTKVASVAVQDRVCYVNLDETFLTPVPNVTAEVTIYSIVNSLVELVHIDEVQISINGDSTGVYREWFPLDVYYEKNLNLIVNDD